MSDTTKLPFFPLGIVAYPGELVNLHIFEPRYRQLFTELETGELSTFVVVPVINGKLMGRATELELTAVAKTYGSGEMDVTALGLRPVDVEGFSESMPDKLYPGGEVKYPAFTATTEDASLTEKLRDSCADLMLALSIHRPIPPIDHPCFSFEVGHRIGMSLEQEFTLLTIDEESDRQRFLLGAIRESLDAAKKTLDMKRKIQQNGHFRYLKSDF
ncbi:MAG: LON peptidase substrate-binding domain-containing protein [Saprospiraceae bacterium]